MKNLCTFAGMKYISWIWHNTRGIRWNTVVRIVAGIGRVWLGLMMVWLSRRFIDETIRTGAVDDVLQMVFWLVLTVVGGVLLRQLGYWLTTTANIYQTNALRLRIFSSLFRRQLFTEKELHSGDVTSRLSKDIEQVSTISTDTLPQMIITAIQLCGAFLLMRWFDARLAWALLLLTPLAVVFGKLIARRLRKMTLDIRQDESRIQMQVQEGMEYNAVLRSLGSEQWVTDRLDSMQQRLRGNVMRRARFTVVMRTVLGFAFGLGYLLAFVWGGLGLRNGTITFGVMTSFLQLVGMIQNPILQLLNMIPAVIHTTASIDRLEEIEGSSPESGEARRGLNERPDSTVQTTPPVGTEDCSIKTQSPDSGGEENTFNVPTIRFALVMQLAHIQHHFFEGGIGLRQVCDYYMLLRHATDDDRREVASRLKRFGLRPMAGAMMWVLSETLHLEPRLMLCEADAKRGQLLLDEILVGGNFGKFSDRKNTDSDLVFILRKEKMRLQMASINPSEMLWVEINHWREVFSRLPERIRRRRLSLR